MKDEGFDYEGIRSENLKKLIEKVMGWGMYGPPLESLFYYAKQAQLEIDGDNRESIGALEDELAATKKELKIINGQLTTTINNWEQAKGKLNREREAFNERSKKLDERDAQTADAITQARIDKLLEQRDKARAEAERYRTLLGIARDHAHACLVDTEGNVIG